MLFLYHIGKGIMVVSSFLGIISLLVRQYCKKRKGAFLIKFILLFSILAFCCSAFLLVFFREVPDVTGLTCDNALQTLREHDLNAVILNYEHDQTMPYYGEVIKEQDPANELCVIGTSITLYYGEKVGSIEDRSAGHPYQNADTSFFAPGKSYAPGDSFFLGSYEQDTNDDNGKEWIEWEVISVESDRLLVISRYGLEYMKFQANDNGHTWNDSSLRGWLNGTDSSSFFGSAFTEEECRYILLSEIKNEENPTYYTSSGKTTYDYVFCLSIDEAIRYFNSNDSRIALPTEHAAATFVGGTAHLDGDHWWLRTMGHKDTEAACVRGKDNSGTPGTINYFGSHIFGDGIMVRPAIWLSNPS